MSRQSEADRKSVRPERGRRLPAEVETILQAGILDQLQDAVLTTDLQGNITACNKGVSLYGYVPEELQGKNIAGLYRPEEQVFLAMQVIPTVLEKGRFEGELRSRAKSGDDRGPVGVIERVERLKPELQIGSRRSTRSITPTGPQSSPDLARRDLER